MKEKGKNKKIRILSLVTAGVSLLAVVPIMFALFGYIERNSFTDSTFTTYYYGYNLYTDSDAWHMILVGTLGLVALLWNLVYGAYAAIDGRYGTLNWKVARYGYFYGEVAGLLNFGVILSYAFSSFTFEPMGYVFLILIAAAVALENVLIGTKVEETTTES